MTEGDASSPVCQGHPVNGYCIMDPIDGHRYVWPRTLTTGRGPLFFGWSILGGALFDVPGCAILTVGGLST